jgi:hypothetical protein
VIRTVEPAGHWKTKSVAHNRSIRRDERIPQA